eukprot:5270318-Prymnesium_polylepis.1
MGRCQFACSRAPSTAWPRADETAHFLDFYHLVSMLSAPPSSPLSVVSVWYQFQCVSKGLSACIGHVQTISAVLLNVQPPKDHENRHESKGRNPLPPGRLRGAKPVSLGGLGHLGQVWILDLVTTRRLHSRGNEI